MNELQHQKVNEVLCVIAECIKREAQSAPGCVLPSLAEAVHALAHLVEALKRS